ncbi:Rv1733c family protein [Actinomycetospora chiangmaiensis]|uniref:Rv1733c family protein n=1 Tax=Actinomycetospora chiangmaiensis TaxID=402650 RepID=UPI00036AB131|nr:hypothetical protein [Actinomycetospora chiangmaiensis]
MRTSGRGRWPDRVRTAFLPRRSALRRRSDCVETAARWIALALLTLAVPFVLVAGSSRSQGVRDDAAHARAVAHHVVGTVTAVRERASRSPDGASSGALDVTVAWTEPDGSVHATGDVTSVGTAPGRRWPMWVDGAGHRVRNPASEADAVVQGLVLVALLLGTAAAVLSGLVAVLRWWLDRRRLRQWDADWLAFHRGRDRGVTG